MKLTGTSKDFEDPYKMAVQMAPAAANKLSRVLIEDYLQLRSNVQIVIMSDFEGPASLHHTVGLPPSTLQSQPLTITGWRLRKSPFFLSDPRVFDAGRLMLQCDDGNGIVLDDSLMEICSVMYRRSDMLALRDEFAAILSTK